jgi:hypothetical protein
VRDESAERFGSAQPFVESGNVGGHAGILARLWKLVFGDDRCVTSSKDAFCEEVTGPRLRDVDNC